MVFRLKTMNPFTAVLGSLKNPIDFLEYFDSQEAIDAGLDTATVRKWETVRNTYFGPTKWTRKQKQAREAARASGFTSDQLHLIESRIKHLTDEREKWNLRFRLLSMRGNFNALKRKADDIVPAKETAAPRKTMAFGKSRGRMRPMRVMAPERDMAALEFALNRRVSADQPAGPQMVDALLEILGLRDEDSGEPAAPPHSTVSSGVAPVSPAVPRPMILIPYPSYIDILNGDGDETVLGLTDGTTMTGAEFLAEHYGEELEVATFHPQHGAVNLYHTKRFANQKQRDLARATLTTCPVPDCRQPSDNCEIHHVEAWSRGGPTNMANLAPLCRYHNRTNDDHPSRNHRGRIKNIRGAPVWCSPRGFPVANKVHPFGAMTLLFGR